MPIAALLLTGGASRRMGSDKAALTVHPGGAETLAERTGRLLRMVADPAWEIGAGHSGLPAFWEDPPGSGPLAAVAAGARALADAGWEGAALVVATDLPFVHVRLLRWLADHPAPGTVIALAGGHPQLLCARYGAGDLARSVDLVRAGHRAIRALVDGADAVFVGPEEWSGVAGPPESLTDVDTPADLARLGLGPPEPVTGARRR